MLVAVRRPRARRARSGASCSTAAGFEPVRIADGPDRGAMPLTVGTAGHIDHGKTWLVRALTGKDTDRLPEEQRARHLDRARLRAARAAGRPAALARRRARPRALRPHDGRGRDRDRPLPARRSTPREGARPQTHEHLAILRLLGVERGVVAVTKADAVDAETLELALAEARELVPGARGRRGQREDRRRGSTSCAAALARAAADVERGAATGAGAPLRRPRLHAARDRHGRHRDALVGLDRRRATSCASSRPASTSACAASQVHDRAGRARRGRAARRGQPAGRRARASCARGDALVAARRVSRSATGSTSRLERARADRAGARVHGAPRDGRRPGARRPRRRPLRAAAPRARLSSRRAATASSCAPARPSAAAWCSTRRRRGSSTRRGCALLERRRPERDRARGRRPRAGHGAELQARGLLPPDELARGLAALERAGDWFFAPEWLEEHRARGPRAARRARRGSSPLDPGMPLGELLPPEPWAPAVLQRLRRRAARREGVRAGRGAAAGRARQAAAAELEARLAAEDARARRRPAAGRVPRGAGRAARVGDGFAVSSRALRPRRARPLPTLSPITLARFRDALGISRRTAQLLLERFDADGITRRVGDERRLRAASRR